MRFRPNASGLDRVAGKQDGGEGGKKKGPAASAVSPCRVGVCAASLTLVALLHRISGIGPLIGTYVLVQMPLPR